MNKDFNKIVLAVDGSEKSNKATDKAFFLAKNLSLDILAIYVLDKAIYETVIPANKSFEHWRSILAQEGHEVLNKIEKRGEINDLKIKTMILTGNPETELLKNIKENDLVIMGNKGKNAIDRIFLGSTTEKIMHHSDSTVMVVK